MTPSARCATIRSASSRWASVNYIHGHNVKWTNQLTYALDEVPSGTSSIGLVTDGVGEDGQVGFISQIQLLF